MVLCAVVLATACNYDDEFDQLNQELGGLNDRLESLEGQVEGLTELVNGLQEIQNQLTTLEGALQALPETSGLSNGVEDLQSRMEAIQQSLGNLDSSNVELQAEIDALNADLEQIQLELVQLLENSNVYPGDLVITSEEELEAILDFMGDRETLIVNGAVIIMPYGAFEEGPFKSATFEWTKELSEKLHSVTSRIIAVLGKKIEVSYFDELGAPQEFFNFFATEEIPFLGVSVSFIDTDIDFPELRSVNGAISLGYVEGNVSMPKTQLIQNIGGIFESYGDSFLNTFPNSVTAYYVQGDITMPSMTFVDNFDASHIAGSIDLSSLSLVKGSLYIDNAEAFIGKQIQTIQGEVFLYYGGGYQFPELESVGGALRLVDVGTGREEVTPTLSVNFPKLAYLSDAIQVGNEYDNNLGYIADNQFSNATYVNVPGYFSADYLDGRNGFGAPLAQNVIVNGIVQEPDDQPYIPTGLEFNAPLADVSLQFLKVHGNLYFTFNSLTADKLTAVDGFFTLIGPVTPETPPQAVVSLPEFTGLKSGTRFLVYNVKELNMPKYIGKDDVKHRFPSLEKLTMASAHEEYLDFDKLQSLTFTALEGSFDFANTTIGDYLGLVPNGLTELSITGKNCASVFLGKNGVGGTAFDALETLSVSGDFYEVHVVGADGLQQLSTAGSIAKWVFSDNGAVQNFNVAHLPGECGPPPAVSQLLVGANNNGAVFTANMDGSSPSILATEPVGRSYFSFYGGVDSPTEKKVYMSWYYGIYSMDYDGSNLQELYSYPLGGMDNGVDVDVDNGHLYFIHGPEGSIYRMGLDGSNPTTIKTGIAHGKDLVLDLPNGHIYYSEWLGDAEGIKRINLDGTGEVTLLSGKGVDNFAIDFVNGKIYYAENTAGYMCDLDGTNITQLFSFQVGEFAIDQASQKLYLTKMAESNSSIVRSNLDGSGMETIVASTDIYFQDDEGSGLVPMDTPAGIIILNTD